MPPGTADKTTHHATRGSYNRRHRVLAESLGAARERIGANLGAICRVRLGRLALHLAKLLKPAELL
jgi:hypothetical protein